MQPKKKILIVLCPTCKSKVEWSKSPSRPFCSERCRLIDLGAWSEGRYHVAATDSPSSEPE